MGSRFTAVKQAIFLMRFSTEFNAQIFRHVTLSISLLAGCASALAEPPPAAPQPASIEGKSWQLLGYQLPAGFTAAQSPLPQVHFANGQLTGLGGCASFSGTYRLSDRDEMTIEKPLHLNAPAPDCAALPQQQQEAMLANLVAVTSYRQVGTQLELHNAAEQPLLRFQTHQSSPLLGNTWLLEFYHYSKQGLVYVLDKTKVSLEFQPQGTLAGNNGCDQYLSGYTLTANQLAIGPVATRHPTCSGTREMVIQAQAYAAALSSTATYHLEKQQLTLFNAQGNIVARFHAAAPPPVLPAPAAPVTATQ